MLDVAAVISIVVIVWQYRLFVTLSQRTNVDVETVALHESGHGQSQAHFGKIFQTEANGLLHFAPFAVMNAAISRQEHSLTGTDLAGHCSLWGSWPNQ